MLQLLNICKSYTTADFTQTALDNVSVSFRDNEFVAILGPSGCGKSTILKLLTGVLKKESGSLLANGREISHPAEHFAYMPQNDLLFPWKNILDNVCLYGRIHGSLKEARDDVLARPRRASVLPIHDRQHLLFRGLFEIDGIDPQTAFHAPDGLRADTARHALPWLEKALNGGLSDAAKNLYNLFSGSEGFPRDRGRQWEIALRGAAAGNPYWEEWCGKMCREEHGREAEAMRWFRQAAHHGQASSWFT